VSPLIITGAADLVAIVVLTFAIFFPRHHRRDLVLAYLGVNVGVFAVAVVLGSSAVGLGLGLGLFGVLSIIRLRSTEIAQPEVAYYFASLALGLVAGLGESNLTVAGALMALVVVVFAIGDHPRLFGRVRSQTMNLDVAFPNEAAARDAVAALVGGRVLHLIIKHVDLVNDSTLVEVRYVTGRSAGTVPGPRLSAATVALAASGSPSAAAHGAAREVRAQA
jgi:hypothetical protein